MAVTFNYVEIATGTEWSLSQIIPSTPTPKISPFLEPVNNTDITITHAFPHATETVGTFVNVSSRDSRNRIDHRTSRLTK